MEMKISELKMSARDSLKGNWKIAITTMLFTLLISFLISTPSFIWNFFMGEFDSYGIGSLVVTLLVQLFILPLSVGLNWFYLNIYDGVELNVKQVFGAFKYWRKVIGALFMTTIFTFLWSLLLIIPGIIKMLSYSQTLFLIKDNPDIGIFEAIKESRHLMKGYKRKLLLLDLSFIGWLLFPIICFMIPVMELLFGVEPAILFFHSSLAFIVGGLYTLGILFFLRPYMSTSFAGFYRQLVNSSKKEELVDKF